MELLTDRDWQIKYDADSGSLLNAFYVPALSCAQRYDRTSGYFEAPVLTLAARGIEGLIRNGGRMRLIVSCRLGEEEVAAIERGESFRNAVSGHLERNPLAASEPDEIDALELLAWMIARGHLEVKVAVLCGPDRKPIATGTRLFHEKAGVIEDRVGNRIAFNGSVNETPSGWQGNWESFHVYRDWAGEQAHVDAEEESFGRLWADRAERARVIDIPDAARNDLLRFEPPDDRLPTRLIREDPDDTPYDAGEPEVDETETPVPDLAPPRLSTDERRRLIWGIIQHGPSLDGPGALVGEATANVTPWPHQIRTYTRMYQEWPPRLLVADEVGLGKTVTIGLLLRQAWLSGRASRILVMAPKGVMRQWQLELREKFNLNWPIYDGQRLEWYPSPGLQQPTSRVVSRDEWHREPFVITSSHLMRREDRARELLNEAEPYDLVVLDEAHHARRRGAGSAGATPNQLLRLMRALSERTPGLVLATATPMQVAPIEVFDLLSLLGVPDEWTDQTFLSFFERCAAENPSPEALDLLASMFRAVEARWGETSEEDARRLVPGGRRLTTRKILKALRDEAGTPRRRLETPERRAALSIMRTNSIVSRLVARHTRELLRRYRRDGVLDINIADRDVRDEFVELSDLEAEVYEAVEDYISTTYQQASVNERSAVGFIMTVYRRRMASSFTALERTLERRLEKLTSGTGGALLEEDLPEDELEEEAPDPDETEALERRAALIEERAALADLLQATRHLPTDSKADVLVHHIEDLRGSGYPQVMVFSQYTDTLDFLRDYLTTQTSLTVLCFSGRGGEQRAGDAWHSISRDEVKRLFREGSADVLLCTDAAGEGLNFQFCGALINYDMPWNPMKVEQRIGRIDRLGQRFPEVRVVNLHYRDTVESDIYIALRERIDLFGQFVGKLQPILSRLPGTIREVTLAGRGDWERRRGELVSGLGDDIADAEASPFDLDAVEASAGLDVIPRPEPLYKLSVLDTLLKCPELLPPGSDVRYLRDGEYAWSQPGMSKPTRVTTDPTYFDEHPESMELWSPGNPTFPTMEDAILPSGIADVAGNWSEVLMDVLGRPSST